MSLKIGSPIEVGISSEKLNHMDSIINNWVNTGLAPSVVAVAIKDGVLVHHKTYGNSGPEENVQELKEDTLFPVSSVSKVITTACVMMLVEDGLVDLFHPVEKYIPEFIGEGKNEVLIFHLLTHSSGLRSEDIGKHIEIKKGKVSIPEAESTENPMIHEMLHLGFDAKLWKKPGEEMSYCGFGFEIASEIIRRVSGMNISDFAKKRIFEPMEMRDTYYIVPDSVKPRIIRRSSELPGSEWLISDELLKTPFADGGVFSTALDIAKFAQLFINNGKWGNKRILSSSSVKMMITNQIPGLSSRWGDQVFPDAAWGCGWCIREDKKDNGGCLRSSKAFDHSGFGGVYVWGDPEYDLVGALFTVMTYDSKGNELWCKDLYVNMLTSAID